MRCWPSTRSPASRRADAAPPVVAPRSHQQHCDTRWACRLHIAHLGAPYPRVHASGHLSTRVRPVMPRMFVAAINRMGDGPLARVAQADPNGRYRPFGLLPTVPSSRWGAVSRFRRSGRGKVDARRPAMITAGRRASWRRDDRGPGTTFLAVRWLRPQTKILCVLTPRWQRCHRVRRAQRIFDTPGLVRA
jgi:hypothetical protein